MSYLSLLTHKARILRPVDYRDRFGQQVREAREIGTNISCRLDKGSASEIMTDRARGVVKVLYRVFLPAGVDITEGDRLDIYDGEGNLLAQEVEVAGVKRVPGAGGRIHHIEADCWRVRSEREYA